ncbi:trypsin-like peptidase domain-containing protein [Actinoplanes sp. NBRC 103695]|uniref:trypsin-like peptidase domain-containing protein n=1 Tax=Actinoplanes sp. NBRC 103695 TaxID=3032202 RepID=UPI0024A0CB24|nr:trypsin-like peptidase domain-containing protein [Actinoplanes sp. NBRC 103695]GLY95341.1 hypothetical protein Acsp02_25960 [Actinoplanes sp. NBRC 103695]
MPPSAELDAVARAQARHSPALRGHPHVIGTATGPRLTAGRATGDLAVKVYVERKLPGLLAPDAVPRFVDGVPTDVIETGPARALSSPRQRPVLGGGSIGWPGAEGGTIASVCFDLRTGGPYLLSNHHVLVMAPETRLRNRVLQPGGGDPGSDVVGRLARAAPLRRVDAAIARLDVPYEPVALPPPAGATLGRAVRKTGSATGVTTGHVQDLHADIVVEVRGRPVRFTGQLVLDLPAAPGDSGSLVVTEAAEPVGLLFAGTDAFVLANPIATVLKALRIRLPAA